MNSQGVAVFFLLLAVVSLKEYIRWQGSSKICLIKKTAYGYAVFYVEIISQAHSERHRQRLVCDLEPQALLEYCLHVF